MFSETHELMIEGIFALRYLRQWLFNLFPTSSSLIRQTSYAKATRGWLFFCNQELIQNNTQSYELNELTQKYIFIAPLQSM